MRSSREAVHKTGKRPRIESYQHSYLSVIQKEEPEKKYKARLTVRKEENPGCDLGEIR